MSVKIDVDASRAIRDFAQVQGRMSLGYFLPLTAARTVLAAEFAANFASAGGGVGGWKPLDPDTVRWKATRGFPPAPLIGPSMALVMELSTLLGPPNVVGFSSATFGTDVEEAYFHQYGTRDMPSRKVVFSPPGFGKQVAKLVNHHILLGSFRG